MERYLLISGGLITIAAFVPAILFFFRAVNHFIRMLTHFRSNRHDLIANVVPFLTPFMPKLFTEQGNVHRRGFVLNFSWFICCVGFIALMFTLLGIGG